MSMRPIIDVLDRPNEADLATTLIHEYAHARLHFDFHDRDERAKREVEAEVVADVVGRYLGLDTTNSAFYLAAWREEDCKVLQERLERIAEASQNFISSIDG